jgi:hypothetical protein
MTSYRGLRKTLRWAREVSIRGIDGGQEGKTLRTEAGCNAVTQSCVSVENVIESRSGLVVVFDTIVSHTGGVQSLFEPRKVRR